MVYNAVQKNIFSSDMTQIALASMVAFFVPFIFTHAFFPNQIFVGILVNALLAFCALRFGLFKSLPVILLPSVAVLLSGLIFAQFSIFLLYLIPFIWLGNAIFVFAIHELKTVRKISYLPSIFFAAFLKSLFLFSAAFALFSIGFIPAALLGAMGIIQFATAITGGLIAGASLMK